MSARLARHRLCVCGIVMGWVQAPALLWALHMSRQGVDVLMRVYAYNTHCAPSMVLSVSIVSCLVSDEV